MRVFGSLKPISQPWTDFQKSGGNTGHFVPLVVPASLAGKDVKFVGKAKEDDLHIDEDRLLVVRLENLTGLTCEIRLGDETAVKYDFTGLVPVGEGAFKAEKDDFGGYGRRDEMVDGFSVIWDGAKGKVSGTLKKHSAAKLEKEGYYLPVGMSDWYFDGVPKKGGINNIKSFTEQDMVLSVTALENPAKFEYNGLTVMELDISGMTMGG